MQELQGNVFCFQTIYAIASCSYETPAVEHGPLCVGHGGAVSKSDGQGSDPGRDHGGHHRPAAILPVRMCVLPVFKCSYRLW